MTLPREVLYYGREDMLAEKIPLRAGPIALVFEAGDLRYLRVGEREVVRRIYVALRDWNWGTVPNRLSNLRTEIGEKSFSISFEVENREREIDFSWIGEIRGSPEGAITFTMDGEARSTFLRNRIGFCVHHPIRECSGAPCRVVRSDGAALKGCFPRLISPHAPFEDIRAISHEVSPGLWAHLRFTGDIFEMEDQRNWTDGSFKTFCTPLFLSYPVEIAQGTRIVQSVTLSLEGKAVVIPAKAVEETTTFRIGTGAPVPLPRLGLGVASHGEPLSAKELDRLKALNLSHLRVDLNLSAPDCPAVLRHAFAESSALGVPLEAAVFLSNDASSELEAFMALLEEVKPSISAWLIFHLKEKATTAPWIRLARNFLTRYDAAARIGSGTNIEFVDLNRSQPPPELIDLACYTINPQAHAFDNDSLVEALEAQGSTLQSARAILRGLPLAITPVTLKRRFNPVATGPECEPELGELPPQVDVRQMSLFGAAWTAGSIKYVSEGGAHSVTYYETSGWRGVMERESGSPLPEQFPSLPGAVFPLYHVLADVGEFRGGEVVPSISSAPLKLDGLALRRNGKMRVLLASFSPQPQRVRVEGLAAPARIRPLDETVAWAAMVAPEEFRAQAALETSKPEENLELDLLPYAVVRLDAPADT